MNKKILIVEDDSSMQEELKGLLENASYDTLILTDFLHAKEYILKTNPDLVLLDVNIPYLNGELLLKELRKESSVPVIILTSRASEIDEVLSISYGADDFITKPYNPTILLLRIQNVFKRVNQVKDKLKYRDLDVYQNRGVLTKDNLSIELTKNEYKILKYLVQNRGKIVSREDIMECLWESESFIDDNTLTVNITRLRNKLEELELKELLETKRGQGYILKRGAN